MRRFLTMLLCLTITAIALTGCINRQAATYSTEEIKNLSFADRNTIFAFDIFKKLNKEDNNIFISPFSISTALSMVYHGAGTATKEAIAKTLRYDGLSYEELNVNYKNLLSQLNQVNDEIELDINNSVWVRQNGEIKKDFLTTSKDIFGAYTETLDFSKPDSATKINKWVSDATKGKISQIVDPPISEDTLMYLINAIYFKAEWTNKFDKELTSDSSFKSGNGQSKQVRMMNRYGTVQYGEGKGYKAVRLPYGNEKTSMYFVLPDRGISINRFIERMDLSAWKTVKESISENDFVTLRLPRFKMEYGTKNLNDTLSDLGMRIAFSNKDADFRGIGENIFIDNVVHKAVIEVNEEGSEAAAATAVKVTFSSGQGKPVEFIADRPFVFIITDNETGTILFMGKLFDVEE